MRLKKIVMLMLILISLQSVCFAGWEEYDLLYKEKPDKIVKHLVGDNIWGYFRIAATIDMYKRCELTGYTGVRDKSLFIGWDTIAAGTLVARLMSDICSKMEGGFEKRNMVWFVCDMLQAFYLFINITDRSTHDDLLALWLGWQFKF